MMKIGLSAALASILLSYGQVSAQETKVVDPNREVADFERYDSENSAPRDAVLFVGSSSINFWRTAEAFPDTVIINRGFGGSTASDLVQYYAKLVLKYRPRVVVLYTGENDVSAGKSAPEVIDTLERLIRDIRRDLPCTQIMYLSIKPSPSRWQQVGTQRLVNEAMQQRAAKMGFAYVDVASPLLDEAGKPDSALFAADRLHLNAAGYALWNQTLRTPLRQADKAALNKRCPSPSS